MLPRRQLSGIIDCVSSPISTNSPLPPEIFEEGLREQSYSSNGFLRTRENRPMIGVLEGVGEREWRGERKEKLNFEIWKGKGKVARKGQGVHIVDWFKISIVVDRFWSKLSVLCSSQY